MFLDLEGGSQKVTLVVVVGVIISVSIPRVFLIHNGAQRNVAYTFLLTFHRSAVSDV